MRPMLIQIRRWLKQAKVWSFVCFGSYAVGLLCYALSASSTHLLGKWTWWKILLYVTVSSIICLLYLFARRRQDSIRSWLGAILVILVLTITSIYSFFSDQKMKAKPDVYILLSWAAFAIASLCLSKQINYGFEVDLLNFFCGGLIILLMKINLWLVIVGVGFTRLLVILGDYLDVLQRSEHLHRSTLDHVVIQIPSDSQQTNIEVDADTANANNIITDSAFVEENSVAKPQEGNSDSGVIMPLFMDCIEALRKENQKLIGMVSKYVDEYIEASVELNSIRTIPVVVDVNLVIDALPSGLIDSLHEKVKLMVEAGFEEQCCHVYSRLRRKFLEEYLSTFGLQVHDLNVENIIAKAESWEKAFTVAVKILFPNEKRLLDRVFQGFSSATDISFKEVCRQSLMPLLSFADTLVMRNHSRDLMRSINAILRNQLRSGLEDFKAKFENQDSLRKRSEVLVLWRTLLLKIDINERMYSINSNTSFSQESIIEQVMLLLSKYYSEDMGDWVDEHRSFLSSLNTWLVDRLESHLKAKCKLYSDIPAQRHVYMMNNLNHVKIMAKEKRLKDILGNDWFAKITEKVQENFELYQRSSWNELLDLLKLDSNVVAESMKAKLNLFNQQFEETCMKQSRWRIFDQQLWEQTIISLENILLPPYENFIQQIRHVLGKHDDECIKYEPIQIQDQLSHLLRDGWPGSKWTLINRKKQN